MSSSKSKFAITDFQQEVYECKNLTVCANQNDQSQDEAHEEQDELLPPGWTEISRLTDNRRQYFVYSGPLGSRARSRVEAWRVYSQRRERASVVADRCARAPSRSVSLSPSPERVAPQSVLGGNDEGYPEDLADYVHFFDRPSTRRAPRERCGSSAIC